MTTFVAQPYWHVHHDVLCELLIEPIETRIAYIMTYKPVEERETRRHLLRPMRGRTSLIEAWIKAAPDAHIASRVVFDAYVAAYAVAAHAAEPDILQFHTDECPDCPWDGKTIFPKKEARPVG